MRTPLYTILLPQTVCAALAAASTEAQHSTRRRHPARAGSATPPPGMPHRSTEGPYATTTKLLLPLPHLHAHSQRYYRAPSRRSRDEETPTCRHAEHADMSATHATRHVPRERSLSLSLPLPVPLALSLALSFSRSHSLRLSLFLFARRDRHGRSCAPRTARARKSEKEIVGESRYPP